MNQGERGREGGYHRQEGPSACVSRSTLSKSVKGPR